MANSKALSVNDIKLANQVFNTWHASVGLEDTLEEITQSSFFAHISRKLRMSDRIIVDREDGTHVAELRVMNAGDNWAKVEVIYEHKAKQTVTSPEEEISTDYEIKWRGRAKWSVIRKADKAVLSENIVEKFDAENWLREHLKAIAL